ncbi:MAG: helix-turn-helix domain-containing protein [Bacteroidota bacterium]
MTLYVKYMVSHRCKMMVKAELKKLHLHAMVVDLGKIEILEDITAKKREQLKINLKKSGLELMDDQDSLLVENIKTAINERIQDADEELKTNYSDYLGKKMDRDYTYLATIFSDVKGITIQQFIIHSKIEKVKELILYEQLSLTEIAARMCYSSVGHLSNQFKKITGHTPTFYKDITKRRREIIDNV